MWLVIVLIPDHCLSIAFIAFQFTFHFLQVLKQCTGLLGFSRDSISHFSVI